jgi:hypothetical protein
MHDPDRKPTARDNERVLKGKSKASKWSALPICYRNRSAELCKLVAEGESKAKLAFDFRMGSTTLYATTEEAAYVATTPGSSWHGIAAPGT